MNKTIISFIITLSIGCASAWSSLSLSFYTGKIINAFATKPTSTLVFKLFCLFIVLIMIASLSQYIVQILANHMAYHWVHQLRVKASNYLNQASLSDIQTFSTGDIAQLLTSDIENISTALSQILNQICIGIPTVTMTLIFMLKTNIPLTIVVLVTSPLVFGFMGMIAKKSSRYFTKQQDALATLASLTEEYIPNLSLVQFFNQEDTLNQDFQHANQALNIWGQKAQWISSLTNPLSRFVDHLTYLGIGLVAGLLLYHDPHTRNIGMISSFILYAGQFAKPFIELSSLTTQIGTAKASYKRFQSWYQPYQHKEKNKPALKQLQGDIILEDVSFGYTNQNLVLHHLNMHFPTGKTIAIIGETGAGKSTIIQLLLKFYTPTKGRILIDGHDMNEYSTKSIRDSIGVVLQDPWLFEGTVRDNLCLKVKQSDDYLMEVLEHAELSDFIQNLPHGLSTIIHPHQLSIGERQLLAIARVMAEDPTFLILDEATSALDYVTEQKITRALEKLMENRTTLLVAHKLSTVKNAHCLYVLKDGKIIEKGTPQLLAQQKDSYYAKLLTINQQGGIE